MMLLADARSGLLRLTGLLVLLLVFGAGAPADLRGQTPVEDRQLQEKSGTELFLRVAEWYATAKEWRGTMMSKVNTMARETRQIMFLRRKYEAMALGELGRLGERVPDWADLGNVCSIDVEGVNICHAPDSLKDHYEGVLLNNFEDIQQTVFEKKADIEKEVSGLIGQQLGIVPGALYTLQKDAGLAHAAQSPKFIEQKARESTELNEVSKDLNMVIDSILVHDLKKCPGEGTTPVDSIDFSECESQEISSGRAQQLAAYLAYTEAKVEIELVRSKIRSLRLGSVRGAEQVAENRQILFARKLADRW